MYWIIGYIIFAVVVGGYMGKQSLRLIKYPERYKKWVHFLFFPMTTAESSGIFQQNGPIIFSTIRLAPRHILVDDKLAKEKRAEVNHRGQESAVCARDLELELQLSSVIFVLGAHVI